MKMKKVLLCAVFAALMTATAFAQSADQDIAEYTERLRLVGEIQTMFHNEGERSPRNE